MLYPPGVTTDSSRDPELFEAIAAAYALVVAADGVLVEAEIARVVDWGASEGFDGPDLHLLRERCRAYAEGLIAHPEDNRPHMLERVAKLEGAGKRATVVLSAARVAVVADARIAEAEEVALAEIATLLGLDPSLA